MGLRTGIGKKFLLIHTSLSLFCFLHTRIYKFYICGERVLCLSELSTLKTCVDTMSITFVLVVYQFIYFLGMLCSNFLEAIINKIRERSEKNST